MFYIFFISYSLLKLLFYEKGEKVSNSYPFLVYNNEQLHVAGLRKNSSSPLLKTSTIEQVY